jgi:isochorismate synthase
MVIESTLYQSLYNLQTTCLARRIPFVSFRLPLETEITTLIQYQSVPQKISSLDEIGENSGFLISPFFDNREHGTYFLKPDVIVLSTEIQASLISMLRSNSNFLTSDIAKKYNLNTTTKRNFENQVNAAVRAIHAGEFQKVVLSKIRIKKQSVDFNTSAFYLKLCEKYPHAFVYLLQLPEVGCWLGATPEPLINTENESIKTVSLAGTQIATEATGGTYVWSSKEIEEQSIVTGFVEQTLRSNGISNILKTGPMNYQAANLIHLKTTFEFSKNDYNSRLSALLKALHPTPSVGGLPKADALNFILKNEKHDRSYYSGFLGPIQINKETNIFVNLRCLQLFEKQFVIYSGAGITASSVAEKEWEETENKMMTMTNVINSM